MIDNFILVNKTHKEYVKAPGSFKKINPRESAMIHFALKEYWNADYVILASESDDEYFDCEDVTDSFLSKFMNFTDRYH